MKKSKKFKKIKLILITIILLIAVVFGVKYIKDNHYIFLYINPNNNTNTYPYISKATNQINELLNTAAKNLSITCPDVKIVYTNGYGSGFLKNNITASDYDYGAGVYLGKYEYDGTNSLEISEKLLKTIALYQANIYSTAKNLEGEFYIQRLTKERIYGIKDTEDTDTALMAKSIDFALKGKPYKMQVETELFLLQPNEIVLPNYNFIKLYNKNISYYPKYRKMLRECTITINYSVDIVDTKENKTYPLTLISSVGDGQRLYQEEFRCFVPNVYTSAKSYKFVNELITKLDDEQYINYKLTNYFHHYTLLSYGNSQNSGSPLKAVKRLLQCTDILAPILPKDVVEKIHNYTYSILGSPTIALINDYYIANGILYNITKATSFYEEIEKNKEVSNHIKNMEAILADMINDPLINYSELKPLFEYQKELNDAKSDVASLQKIMKEKSLDINHYVDKLMFQKMPNNKKITLYMTYLNKVLETGGLYNIKFYKNNPDHIYVFKDNFTKKLDLNKINELKIMNGYYTISYDKNTKFEYMNPADYHGDSRRITNGWVRYNTTELQNTVYNDIKTFMLKDRPTYNLKIRAGLTR